jgi:hypothetical protein
MKRTPLGSRFTKQLIRLTNSHHRRRSQTSEDERVVHRVSRGIGCMQ